MCGIKLLNCVRYITAHQTSINLDQLYIHFSAEIRLRPESSKMNV